MRNTPNISELLRKDDRLTSFQKKVYKAVLNIPEGTVRSYKWVAREIGKPKAARAIGQALKRNPYTVTVPCHRVIKSDGSLGGYSRGACLKRKLLAQEGLTLRQSSLDCARDGSSLDKLGIEP